MSATRVAITPAQLAQIEVLAGYGLDQTQIAAALGLGDRTFRRRKADTAAVADAIARGQAKAAGRVAETLFKRATGSGRDAVAAIKWWEMTRANRSERTSGTVGSVDLTKLSDAQLDRIAAGDNIADVIREASRD